LSTRSSRPATRRRTRAAAAPALLAAALLGGALGGARPGAAWAAKPKAAAAAATPGDLSGLEKNAAAAEAELKALREKYLKPKPPRTAEDVQRRINEGQVFYILKDYVRSSIVFFEIVEDATLFAHPGYKDAVFFLADSLFHNKNYKTAKEYFEKILSSGFDKYKQDAILRLIEIALLTDDDKAVDAYWARLADVPPEKIKNELKYVHAKALHRRGDLDGAAAAFATIPKTDYWYMPARYFLGAIEVAQGRLAAERVLAADKEALEAAGKAKAERLEKALGYFDETVALEPIDPALKTSPAAKADSRLKRILDLANLSRGRVLYELGKTTEALEAYQEVDRKSPEFDQALYESAWVNIRMREFETAARYLDILMLATPDSVLVPEVRLLRGNLLLRIGKFPKATEEFEKVIKDFQPVFDSMEATLRAHPDPVKYFAEKVHSLTDFDFKSFLPPLAQKWAAADTDVSTALTIASDMVLTKKNIEESETIVELLEDALSARSRVDIFADLAEGAGRAYGLGHNLVLMKRAVVEAELLALSSSVTTEERAKITALEEKRRELEALYVKLPRDIKTFRDREKGVMSRFDDLDKAAFLLSYRIDAMKARVVALEAFFRDRKERGLMGDVEATSEREKIDGEKALIATAEDALTDLRKDLNKEKARVGLGDDATVIDDDLKRRYSEVLSEEHTLVAEVLSRAGGAGGVVSRAEALIARITAIEAGLRDFNTELETYVAARVEEFASIVREEKAKLVVYRTEMGGIEGDVTGLAGELAFKSFLAVKGKFYDLVLQADVGFLDVAWSEKELKSDAVSKLVSAKARDLKVLDREFDEVLGGDVAGEGSGEEK
jgi:tetratricopeptide (TPR) repeat protein